MSDTRPGWSWDMDGDTDSGMDKDTDGTLTPEALAEEVRGIAARSSVTNDDVLAAVEAVRREHARRAFERAREWSR